MITSRGLGLLLLQVVFTVYTVASQLFQDFA